METLLNTKVRYRYLNFESALFNSQLFLLTLDFVSNDLYRCVIDLIFFSLQRDKLEPRIVEELSDYYHSENDDAMNQLIKEVPSFQKAKII